MKTVFVDANVFLRFFTKDDRGQTDGRIVQDALTLAKASGQEFVDAYIASASLEVGADAVVTFNRKHFDQLGVTLQAF